MPAILKDLSIKTLCTLITISLVASFFQSCNKKSDTLVPKPNESDTTITFAVDSSALSENLTDDEFGIYLKLEDTTSIPFSDLLLPTGDTLVKYITSDFLNQYPLDLRQINTHHGLNRGSGYKTTTDQVNALNSLLAQITGKAQYLKTLRGNPLFPVEGYNKPAQLKIGYASGGIKECLFKGNLIKKEISGRNYKIRSFNPGCVDSTHALNAAGFFSTIFDVDGVKNFPFTLSGQSNATILKSSLPDGLDKNKFEIVDLGSNFPEAGLLTGDIVSFFYNDNPVPNHIGLAAKGQNDHIQLYHSIGNLCDRNQLLLAGPVTWNMSKLNESNLTGSKGSIKYQVKRIRYIAELEMLPSITDSTPGATNTIQMKVFSSDNLPIKDNMEVQFSTADGTITSTGLTKNGLVQTNWQFANRSGGQTFVATIKSPLDNATVLDQIVCTIAPRGVPMLNVIDTNFITKTIATIKARLKDDGGSAITELGLCYSTHPNVSVLDNKIPAINAVDSFVLDITGLTKNTTYYARSYAKNASGIGYSDEISFTTLSDVDDPFDLSGIWKGWYSDSGSFDTVFYPLIMKVTIRNSQFKGLVTIDLPPSGGTLFNGVVTSDGTQLTLSPIGTAVFENPWTIAGNIISGVLDLNRNSVPFRRPYKFTKQ